ncbi:MAG: phosphate signaling complex protein PhoU [Candidatus Sedimenticola endophacoides]
MSDNTTGRHTMRAYADELKQLHTIVLEMSERVRTQIRDAVNSLEHESPDEAWLVFEAEKRVNELDTSADDQIIHIIAKRQPVARDLREILAVSKIVGDLERIGDLACRVARLTTTFYEGEHLAPSAQMRRDVPHLAHFVDEMIDTATRAYDTLDLTLALQVIERNEVLEQEFKVALRRISTYILEDSRNVGCAADLVLGLRALECIGGHARNISRHVVFLVKGHDVRHKGREAIAAESR